MKDQLFQIIDLLNDEYVKMWEDVCNIESPTHFKAGVDAVGEYFISYARQKGWKVDVFHQERAGNVVTITMNPDAKAAPVAFSGHMDTVHEVGSFGYPPVRIEGDRIYGPGVTDCKGGIVVGFLAMDALRRLGFKDRPVVMYLQSDEEGGGKYSGDATINHICEVAQGSVAFLNLEGAYDEKLCVGRKGIANFEFTVTGVEAHTSKCASIGANAILEAAHKIIALESFKDPDGLTCCCAMIHGGTKHNIIPGECRFTANVRFARMSELDEFTAAADCICKDIKVSGCSCSYVVPRIRPAMEADVKNTGLARKINEIWSQNGLSEFGTLLGAGGSDAANVSAAGIPAVDDLGVAGGEIHTIREFGYIPSLASQAKRLALIALYI